MDEEEAIEEIETVNDPDETDEPEPESDDADDDSAEGDDEPEPDDDSAEGDNEPEPEPEGDDADSDQETDTPIPTEKPASFLPEAPDEYTYRGVTFSVEAEGDTLYDPAYEDATSDDASELYSRLTAEYDGDKARAGIEYRLLQNTYFDAKEKYEGERLQTVRESLTQGAAQFRTRAAELNTSVFGDAQADPDTRTVTQFYMNLALQEIDEHRALQVEALIADGVSKPVAQTRVDARMFADDTLYDDALTQAATRHLWQTKREAMIALLKETATGKVATPAAPARAPRDTPPVGARAGGGDAASRGAATAERGITPTPAERAEAKRYGVDPMAYAKEARRARGNN